ncbi:MAG: small ribosomal subunit Rsm22 family protein [Bacteroidota bacterium]|nr:small ribosomal subunit Rsm22 family protein [Bacteroidota bacterium]
MQRNALDIPDEYIAALSERLSFDLTSKNLITRSGKAYITKQAGIVSAISKGLTQTRSDFLASEYLKNREIREAYALYYMTTNLLKVFQPMRELALSGFFDRSSLRILDLGCGTGSATWGTELFLRSKNKDIDAYFTLTDSLDENLAEAKTFSNYFLRHLSGTGSHLEFEQYDLRLSSEKPPVLTRQPYDLVIMMNVLNELDEKDDTVLLNSLTSLLDTHGAIVIIEPATREQSRRLLRLRDLAVRSGATMYSPCSRQEGCPALVDPDDWCHTDVPWVRPPFIEAIDNIAGTLRLSLKYSYIVISKDGVTLSKSIGMNHLYRVVSERFNEKGRIRAILCGENGRCEHIINKRDRSEANADFASIERYDVVKLDGAVLREHDAILSKDSDFSIVLPVLGAR